MKIIYQSANQENQLAPSAVALGMFDGVHLGHQEVLKKAVQYAQEHNLQSAVVTMDDHPCKLTKNCMPLLITPLQSKLIALEKLGFDVVYVLHFDETLMNTRAQDYLQKFLINIMNAKYIVTGYDHYFGKDREGSPEYLRNWGLKNHTETQLVPAFSLGQTLVKSSILRDLISQGKIKEANLYLGYNFFIYGKVIKGKQLGSQIGFPTANIETAEHQLLPATGVYEAKTYIDGKTFEVAVNIGYRPTVDQNTKLSVEAHVIGFSGDLYNKFLNIEFINKIREEKKFNSIEELKQQIKFDIEMIECKNLNQ
ncbi:MAG: bifunctional riboflavin kinase/FAD synthetase [Candidatus Caenarcaniphilales bacterium]|jgi:riboflavin kinase/FMN adenylyltransferase|nr:bifunctional riboflavin kinase/FAD synthetase [Candidatus Caenarcaniphilales bacterium]